MPAALPDWRRAAGAAVASGRLRSRPEDFRVEERLDLPFSGDGEHDWLFVEKTGANTAWVAAELARAATVPRRDVGYSGLKDRHAVTRQWFSVRRPGGPAVDWPAITIAGVSVLAIERHRRKLKRGTHRDNHFEILLRDVRGDPHDALERIAGEGVPNYFGEQRFGRAAGNLRLANELLQGGRLPRARRSLALSAARAFLFNSVLDRRVAAGSWNRLEAGDIAMLAGSRSRFDVDAVDDTLEQRCRKFDLHPSGPLCGRGDEPEARPATEREVLEAFGDTRAALGKLADADRRPLRLVVRELEWQSDRDTLQLRFALASGSFATAVLREFVSWETAPA